MVILLQSVVSLKNGRYQWGGHFQIMETSRVSLEMLVILLRDKMETLLVVRKVMARFRNWETMEPPDSDVLEVEDE